MFRQLDADRYELVGKLPTAADAKTSLYVPEFKRFFVAVPKRNVAIPPTRDVIQEDASLLVYRCGEFAPLAQATSRLGENRTSW